MLEIHKLRDIKYHVQGEEPWIKKGITLPNLCCSYSKDLMNKYATLVFDNPDGRCVLNGNPYILASDLATVAGTGWISHAILNGITDILQTNTKHTSVFMLNDVLLINDENLKEYLSGKTSRSTKAIVFLVNVGKTRSNQVYIFQLYESTWMPLDITSCQSNFKQVVLLRYSLLGNTNRLKGSCFSFGNGYLSSSARSY